MKFVNLCFAGALFFGATCLFSAGHDPAFGTGDFDGTITMASSGALCGGVTLAPELGQNIAGGRVMGAAVKLVSYRVHKEWIWDQTPKWTRIGEMTIREPVRVRYDWAGINQSDRYAIKCYVESSGLTAGEFEMPCSEVVKISDVRQDKGCVIGPAGPEAEYGALGMNKG